MLGLRIKALPMDAEGLCIEPLETLLQRTRPKVLYCMPSFQNPSGACLSMRRRKDLVALAARHNFAILEDDYVGDLRYDGRALPSLRTLDQDGTVIYTGTFSKMLAPGLRIGFLVAEGPVLKHLCAWKRNLELSGPPLLQRALQAYVSVGLYRRYLKRSRSVYRQRRDAMATALTRELGHSAQWKVPQGGLFFWVKLRRKRKGLKLLEEARSQGLNFALGDDFFVTKPEHTWLRLNFAANEIPISERAVAILGKLLR
jgi:GntR family transcriptional regulator/MocR family aminotransferase